MISDKRLVDKAINPDLAYALWVITDSITRATKRLEVEGIINPSTNKPFTRMGVWFAAKKSPYYEKFVEDRRRNKEMSTDPTQAELVEAKGLMETLIPTEREKIVKLIDKYAQR